MSQFLIHQVQDVGRRRPQNGQMKVPPSLVALKDVVKDRAVNSSQGVQRGSAQPIFVDPEDQYLSDGVLRGKVSTWPQTELGIRARVQLDRNPERGEPVGGGRGESRRSDSRAVERGEESIEPSDVSRRPSLVQLIPLDPIHLFEISWLLDDALRRASCVDGDIDVEVGQSLGIGEREALFRQRRRERVANSESSFMGIAIRTAGNEGKQAERLVAEIFVVFTRVGLIGWPAIWPCYSQGEMFLKGMKPLIGPILRGEGGGIVGDMFIGGKGIFPRSALLGVESGRTFHATNSFGTRREGSSGIEWRASAECGDQHCAQGDQPGSEIVDER